MASLNSSVVHGSLAVTNEIHGKLDGTVIGSVITDANKAIPAMLNKEVFATSEVFVVPSSGSNVPNASYNWHISAIAYKATEATKYRLTQTATGSGSSGGTVVFERAGYSSNGTAWSFSAWVSITDTNTDTKVTQTAKTDNVNYPLLAASSASPTSGAASTAVYDTGVTLNPSTNTISANISGSAATLGTARTIQTNLGSTSSASFDGSANITPGVTGTLPVANGGTGATTAANARTNLGAASATDVSNIKKLIPTEATETNKLADKNYVDNACTKLEAHYLTADASGNPFATHAALTAATKYYYQGAEATPDTNDIVTVTADEDHKNGSGVACVTRYRWNGSSWAFEYVINNSGLTTAQSNALNSGITSTKVSSYDTHIGSKSNPHGVTYSQVGAAAASHKHTKSEITDFAHTHSLLQAVTLNNTNNVNNLFTDQALGVVSTYTWESINQPSNLPSDVSGKSGILVAYNTAGSNYGVQEVTVGSLNTCVYRRHLVNGTWDAWKKVYYEATSTYSSTGTQSVNGTAVAAAINTLDVSDTAVANKFVTAVSETDGKISVSRASLTATNIAQAGTLSNSTTGNAATATTASNTYRILCQNKDNIDYTDDTKYQLCAASTNDFCGLVLMYDVTDFYDGTISNISAEHSLFYGDVSLIRRGEFPAVQYSQVALQQGYNTSRILYSNDSSCYPIVVKETFENVSRTWNTGAWTFGAVGTTGTLDTSVTRSRYCVISCTEGESYYLNVGCYVSDLKSNKGYAFVDNNSVIKAVCASYNCDEVVTVPAGATKLIVQTYTSYVSCMCFGKVLDAPKYYLALKFNGWSAGTIEYYGRFYTRTAASGTYHARPLLLKAVSNLNTCGSDLCKGYVVYATTTFKGTVQRASYLIDSGYADHFNGLAYYTSSPSSNTGDSYFGIWTKDSNNNAILKSIQAKNMSVGKATDATNADYVKFQDSNEINFKNIPTTAGTSRRVWFNYRNADTHALDSTNLITGYYFGNRNATTTGVTLYADNFSGKADSATKDGNGDTISSTYLKLSGGTMTGLTKHTSTSLTEFSGAPSYLVGIDAFTAGGTMHWKAVDKIKVGEATTASEAKSGSALETAINGKVTANTAITGATKTKITYDSKGLVTAGADATLNDMVPLATASYTGLTSTANNSGGSGCDFILGEFNVDTTSGVNWILDVELEAKYTASDWSNNLATSNHICHVEGFLNSTICSSMWNNFRTTSYRPFYYFVIYRPSTSSNKFYFGVCMYNCNRNITTDGTNLRSIKVNVRSTKYISNLKLHDSTANTDYATYYQNMAGRSVYDICNNGLRESGDDNNTVDLFARDVIAYTGTAAGTADKAASMGQFVYKTGSVTRLYLAIANTASSKLRLQINGQGYKDIYLLTASDTWTVTSSTNKTMAAGAWQCYYNGTNWYCLGTINAAGITNDNALLVGQASYATKNVFVDGFKLVPGATFKMYVYAANTSATALNLNVNLTGAKPMFINGTLTSTSAYTLAAGWYYVYYDGTNYHVNNTAGMTFWRPISVNGTDQMSNYAGTKLNFKNGTNTTVEYEAGGNIKINASVGSHTHYSDLRQITKHLDTGAYTDTTEFVTSNAGGYSADYDKHVYSRSALLLWNYINGKLSGTSVNIGGSSASCTGNAATASEWATARNFTIKDADQTNSGTAVAVKGNENETLLLPSTIKATLTGNASSATYATALSFPGGRITNANVNDNSRFKVLQVSQNMSTGKPVSDGWIMHFNWDTNMYASQISVPNNSNAANKKFQFRQRFNKAPDADGAWEAWGAMPMDITGNAGSASAAKSGSALETAINGKVTANTAITGATKCKITYDSKGLVTSGADLAASDIPNLNASKITAGTFADDRIASAATWNAKQSALPTTGTVSTTYAINVSGSAASATSAGKLSSVSLAANGKIAIANFTDNAANGTIGYSGHVSTWSDDPNGELLIVGTDTSSRVPALRFQQGDASDKTKRVYGTLKPSTLTANREWILPDVGGTIALTSSNVASATTATDYAATGGIATALAGKQGTLATQTAYSAKGSATKVPQITTNSLGQVTKIEEVTITDNNYYPTAFSWTAGTTAGPTGSLTGTGMSAVSFGAIPSASATASGIVTTGAQTFAGVKTHNAHIVVNPGTISNFREGIRLNQATGGYAIAVFGGAANSESGTGDGVWLVGRRGAAGSTKGGVGDFSIENNGSNGTGLTIFKAGGAYIHGAFEAKNQVKGETLNVNSKVTMQYNTTNSALDFVFA